MTLAYNGMRFICVIYLYFFQHLFSSGTLLSAFCRLQTIHYNKTVVFLEIIVNWFLLRLSKPIYFYCLPIFRGLIIFNLFIINIKYSDFQVRAIQNIAIISLIRFLYTL